jgi:hypothetical protein
VASNNSVSLIDNQGVDYAKSTDTFAEGATLLVADKSRVASPFLQLGNGGVFYSVPDFLFQGLDTKLTPTIWVYATNGCSSQFTTEATDSSVTGVTGDAHSHDFTIVCLTCSVSANFEFS